MMVVLMILGVLIAVALPNFIGAQDRARLAGVKTNMHNFRNMIEIYAVDWHYFPVTYAELGTAAKAGGYAKSFKNPVTNHDVSFDTNTDCLRVAEFITGAEAPPTTTSTSLYTGPGGAACSGQVIYSRASVVSGTYAIYGLDSHARYLFDKSMVMLMSNS